MQNQDALCRKITGLQELTGNEKRYLEALVQSDRLVTLYCPRCGAEMRHTPIRKLEFLRDYQEAVRSVEQARAICRDWQDNIRKIGSLRTLIAREPDEKERLRLCILAIAVMTGDQVFRRTELERLEEKQNHEETK